MEELLCLARGATAAPHVCMPAATVRSTVSYFAISLLYRQTRRHADRQTGRQTDRQADRETERQRDRETERQGQYHEIWNPRMGGDEPHQKQQQTIEQTTN